MSFTPSKSYKTSFCPSLLYKGFCDKHFLCSFAHYLFELRTENSPLYPLSVNPSTESLEFSQAFIPDFSFYKTKNCRNNFCKNPVCEFAHSSTELRDLYDPIYPLILSGINNLLINENKLVDSYISEWASSNQDLLN